MLIANIFNRKFYLILATIFFVEILSLLSFLIPKLALPAFFFVVFITFIVTIKKLEYGMLIALVELIIGSKGYLFFFENEGLTISIRIALWLIVISIWLAKLIISGIKNKKIQIEFLQSRYIYYYILFFLFILWGLINGLLNSNSLNNIFFDFNNWLYLLLILPLYAVFNLHGDELKKLLTTLLRISAAAVFWLCFKSLLILYIFSHNFGGFVYELYRWIRVSGVGEVTLIQGGFYRVFFQSHIFILISFFIAFYLLINFSKSKVQKNKLFILFFITSFFLAINILNFSRSNWVGLAAGLLISFFIIIKKINWKTSFKALGILISCAITGFILMVIIVEFPLPEPIGGFNTTNLLSERAGRFAGEAALSSRWELYPHLKNKIIEAPIIGHGFGATVTYQSSDPRVLEQSATGEYTTYAFEWGWLDIWIKLGIFGILIYISLIFKIFITGITRYSLTSNYSAIYLGLLAGLAAITVVSFFSPYMNHPLGLGFLMLVSVIFDYLEKNKLPL